MPSSSASRPQAEDPEAHEVLIVGAGPSGMVAACELLRRGVRVRIVDRAPAPSPFPKALLVWPRSIDLFEDLGVLAHLRDAGTQINAFSYFSERRLLASFDFPQHLSPVCLPQNETERILRERMEALGGKVERGVRLLTLEGLDFSGRIAGTGDVTAVLEHEDGRVERTGARFVIGADGAGSAVRGLLGGGFTGNTYESSFALVDTRIKGFLPPDQALYYQSPAGALVVVALPDGVFRFFCSLPAGERVTVERMQRIVDDRGPAGVTLTDPVWVSDFRIHARHADQFQLGRVFIVGDAAHVHSPAGGQGLNTGIQDAHNLAWKMAAVLHGKAPSDLLRTYGPERAAVARRVVRDTDIQTRSWLVKRPTAVVARDAAFRVAERTGLFRLYAPVMAGRRLAYPAVRQTQLPAGRTSCHLRSRLPGGLTVGAVFPRSLAVPAGFAGTACEPAGWTLAVTCRGDAVAWREQARALAAAWPQVRAVDLSARSARTETGCRHQGYYLVRPDGHVAAHGHAGDLDRLHVELTQWLGPADRVAAR
ncbi:FAD-dependent monooxygenase [Streptomyces sp. NPDC001599]|uniref:FAD-dependent monooxygenase n=1 Tax=Streptomyces sp. NPDC001599 TaxID=3364591 RepID=UPI0036A173AE